MALKVRFRRKLYVLFMLYNIRLYYNITYMLLYIMLCHVIIVNYDYDIQFTYIYTRSLYRVIVYVYKNIYIYTPIHTRVCMAPSVFLASRADLLASLSSSWTMNDLFRGSNIHCFPI